ncbi:MAG: Holliday junction branch migration protein RuvA [Alphaproteobacteria bacterium]|nr:Holliday junction branch migration protein RuvA [Alphaproteobacteria bacterium]
MIAKLTGTVDTVGDDFAVIDVGGVGYLVHASARTLGRLPGTGGAARLLIETVVREDRIQLLGFADAEERDWMRLLSSVQGVGTRLALALLSVASPTDLARAVAAGDKSALTRAPGVGPKLAGRIVAELKDRVAVPVATAALVAESETTRAAAADAISALVNLGYREAEASGAIARAVRQLGQAAAVEDLIRAGLKGLGP